LKTLKLASSIILLSGLTILSPLYAAHYQNTFQSGIYLGLQFGYADFNYSKTWLTKKSGFTSVGSVDTKNYAGRFFAGYAFNQYASLELGYLLAPKVKFENINNQNVSGSFTQYVGDLSGKLTLPIGHLFGIYVRGGAAYVHRDELAPNLTSGTASVSASNKATPVVGIGINTYIKQHYYIDLSYMRYLKTGDLPRMDFYSLGLAYKF